MSADVPNDLIDAIPMPETAHQAVETMRDKEQDAQELTDDSPAHSSPPSDTVPVTLDSLPFEVIDHIVDFVKPPCPARFALKVEDLARCNCWKRTVVFPLLLVSHKFFGAAAKRIYEHLTDLRYLYTPHTIDALEALSSPERGGVYCSAVRHLDVDFYEPWLEDGEKPDFASFVMRGQVMRLLTASVPRFTNLSVLFMRYEGGSKFLPLDFMHSVALAARNLPLQIVGFELPIDVRVLEQCLPTWQGTLRSLFLPRHVGAVHGDFFNSPTSISDPKYELDRAVATSLPPSLQELCFDAKNVSDEAFEELLAKVCNHLEILTLGLNAHGSEKKMDALNIVLPRLQSFMLSLPYSGGHAEQEMPPKMLEAMQVPTSMRSGFPESN